MNAKLKKPSAGPGANRFFLSLTGVRRSHWQQPKSGLWILVAAVALAFCIGAHAQTVQVSGPSGVNYGQSATFSASISQSGINGGTMNFLDNGSTFCGATISNSRASCTTNRLLAGTHTITAEWVYASKYSTNSVNTTVYKTSPTASVSTSGTPSTYGGSVTFTATVSGGVTGPPGPTGSITFYDNGGAIGSGSLSGTTASFATSGLVAGSHSITASYSGDSNFNSVTSGAITQTVNKATPSLSVSCSPNPITYGSQTTTCTPSISGGTTGSLSWTINGSAWTTGGLSQTEGGFAGYAAAAYTIGITYSGDSNHNSVSASTTLTISKVTPSLSISCSPNPITYGSQTTTCTPSISSGTTGSLNWTINGGAWTTGGLSQTQGGFAGYAAGNYTIGVAYSGDTNHNAVSASTTLTIGKATPSISVSCSPNPITYGGANSTCTASVSGGGTTPTGTVALTYNGTAWTTQTLSSGSASATWSSTFGTSTYIIAAAYSGDGNYQTASSSTNLVVSKATPTITWSPPASIVYGTALSSTQLDATSSVAGTLTYTPAAGKVLGAGTTTLSVTLTPSDSTDYNSATTTEQITVSKATPTITWSPPASIVYGTALSSTQLDATSSVAGTFTYTPAAGTVLGVGTTTLSVTLTPSDSTDYNSATTTEPITVNKATPTITWTPPASIDYGTALSSTQLDATSGVAGTFTYTPAAGTVLAVGTTTLSVTFTPTDSTDYNPATTTQPITVLQATPTITWPSPAAVDYGVPLSSTQLDATASVAGTFLYDPSAGTYLTPGNQVLAVTFTPTNTTDYNVATATVPLTVNSPTGSIASEVYRYSLTYYPNGNVKSYWDSSNGSLVVGSWSYSYDTLNRLIGAEGTQPNSAFTNYCWSYDAFGNRWQQYGSNQDIAGGGDYASSQCQPQSGSSITYEWAQYAASNNQLSATTQSPSPGSVQHDASGDVTYDGRNSYLYNAEGQICAVSNTYNSITTMIGYVYDADGQRVAKGTITTFSCDVTTNGFQTQSDYVRDQAGNQLSEFTPGSGGSMVLAHTNVWANGVLVATDDVNKTHFYLNDWLGTRRVQTDDAGNLEQSCASLPYGDGETCGPAPTENLYTGKERDSESGLDNFGARYFGSTMGRFMSPDYSDEPDTVPYAEFENPQTLNLYAYGHNNPLTYNDPDGHDVSVCSNNGNGGQTCNTISNEQYAAAQKAGNGGLNVPTLDQVGMNGNGSGQFNSTAITDANGNTVGSATYVSNGGADYYANRNGFNLLAQTSATVGSVKGVASFYGASALLGAGVAFSPVMGAGAGLTTLSIPMGLQPGAVVGGFVLTAHAVEQAQERGVTLGEIEEAVEGVAKSNPQNAWDSVQRFYTSTCEVRVNKITGTIVTVISKIKR